MYLGDDQERLPSSRMSKYQNRRENKTGLDECTVLFMLEMLNLQGETAFIPSMVESKDRNQNSVTSLLTPACYSKSLSPSITISNTRKECSLVRSQ